MKWQSSLIGAGIVAIAMIAVAGCGTMQFYAQAVSGHLAVMAAAQPIDQSLFERPAITPLLKAKLERVLAIRQFAVSELQLPDNGSYRSYADIGRPYVLWNVIAAEEFSLRPKESCFLFAGCVAYRGFYAEADANAYGEAFRKAGLDVFVYGVTAYSTLGWFNDPVLNTVISHSEVELARIIFHEIVHQVAYTKDDSVFNESFAAAVEEEGVRRWVDRFGSEQQWREFAATGQRRAGFVALISRYQKRFAAAYAIEAPILAKREEKSRLFAALRADYETMKRDEWGGFPGYDRWFAQDLNNAHLASVATYTELVPAFRRLLAKNNGDFTAFYREVKGLAARPKAERLTLLGA
ncbi:MAG: aminopeptidase [Betaproteobacteria bacterium]|nr:aminopeptidase [Betaproteobacteria bacterium]